MKWRNHGANPDKLYKQFNIEIPDRIIDFSTNTNVLPLNIDTSVDLENLIMNYPDDESTQLRDLISSNNDLSADNVLVTNGANEAIYIIASYLKDKRVGIIQPTYSEYEKALRSNDAEVVYFYNFEEVKDIDVLFLCNPNNPTGKHYSYNEVIELLESNIDVIIDESYIDFLYKKDKVIDVNKYSNVYILRSLTKIYHLSGLRIGYVLSNKSNIEKLKKRQPTWSVNSIAQHFAYKFLLDEGFIQETRLFYKKEKSRLVSELREMNYKILNSDVNYFLIEVSNDIDIIKFLLRKGIVVRHTRNYPSLDGKYIRVAVRTIEENNILINTLKEYRYENNID